MGEGTSQSGQAVGAREPEQIRREIEEVREHLGDTVEALAAKTDVKARTREKAGRIKAGMRDRAPQGEGPERVVAVARQNPLPLALAAALAVGFLIGRRRARDC